MTNKISNQISKSDHQIKCQGSLHTTIKQGDNNKDGKDADKDDDSADKDDEREDNEEGDDKDEEREEFQLENSSFQKTSGEMTKEDHSQLWKAQIKFCRISTDSKSLSFLEKREVAKVRSCLS